MSELRVSDSPIPGLKIVDIPVHGDSRGWFKENWQREKMVSAGLPDLSFVQNNISFNESVGTTRGIHAEPWDKYVSVASGKIFGAWVDLRQGKTFGTVFTTELTPGQAVFVPRGVGNSFQTLQPDTAYTYLVTDHWSAQAQSQYTFVNADDPELGIAWPIPLEQAQRSHNDLKHPRLCDVVPMMPAPLLILGAGGQVGRALVKACQQMNIAYEAYGRDQWDMTTPQCWPLRSVRGYRAVINAAAYTAVDRAQTVQGAGDAWQVNACGVAALVNLCRQGDVPLAHISTDYVFDGFLPVGREYEVDAQPAPLSVYGQSKAAGETAVQTWDKHWLVRTSWVVGEPEDFQYGTGSHFVDVMYRLAIQGANPDVVADQVGRLSFAHDLARAIIELITAEHNYGIYHATNSGPVVSWATVAQWIFELTGDDPCRVRPVSSETYFAHRPDAAPRPLNSALSTRKLQSIGINLPDAYERLTQYLRVSDFSYSRSSQ